MAVDLEVRTAQLFDVLAQSIKADLHDPAQRAREACQQVRDQAAKLPDSAALPADALGAHARRLGRLTLTLDAVEWRIRAALERYGEPERIATAMLRGLLGEAGWTGWVPVVQTWSSNYFWAYPSLRLIGVPPGEHAHVLRIPDVLHEFGHCLYHTHKGQLTAPLITELLLWSASAPRGDAPWARWFLSRAAEPSVHAGSATAKRLEIGPPAGSEIFTRFTPCARAS